MLHVTDENAQLRTMTKNWRQMCTPKVSQLKSGDPQVRQLTITVCQKSSTHSWLGIMEFQKQVQHRLCIWNKNIRPLDSAGIYQKVK